jgi:hypothetical protein
MDMVRLHKENRIGTKRTYLHGIFESIPPSVHRSHAILRSLQNVHARLGLFGSLGFLEDVEPTSEDSDNSCSRSGGGVGKGVRPDLGNLDVGRSTVRPRILEEAERGSGLRDRSMGLENIG